MAKYSSDLKVKITRDYFEGGESFNSLEKKYSVERSTIIKWIKLYHYHGIEGLVMKRGSYDGQFKIDVIEYMHANHMSIRETAAKFGIPAFSTVRQWERIYHEEGRMALFRNNRGRKSMDKENKRGKPKLDKKNEEDLIAENQRLRMENAYLKKLHALVQERIQQENGKK